MKVGDLVKLACKPRLGIGVVIQQTPTPEERAEEPRFDTIVKVQWPRSGRSWYSPQEVEIVSESR
jgi:hypothetical protein